jgi:aquaporin Z
MEKTGSMLPLFVAEFIGTALLLAVGLSMVILFWSKGSPMAGLLPNEPLRRALTGFLFGSTGCAIALSRVGKISGAHINPAVSFTFWCSGKMTFNAFLGYTLSQSAGAVVGSLPLLLWGQQGGSIHYGNTVPGPTGTVPAFWGEVVATAALMAVVFVFTGRKKLRNYTPFAMPFLYSLLVWTEAPLSGCSTNPARSLGPAVISQVYTSQWLYWLAPLTGALAIILIYKGAALHKHLRIEAARISHHDHPTHSSLKPSPPES